MEGCFSIGELFIVKAGVPARVVTLNGEEKGAYREKEIPKGKYKPFKLKAEEDANFSNLLLISYPIIPH